MADILLVLICALLAALVVLNILRLRSKPVVIERTIAPQQPSFHHYAELHKQPKQCSICGLVVVRYDQRGVCANCVSEGK